MSKILQAIEAKQRELESSKQSMREAVESVTATARQNIEECTKQSQEIIKQNTTEYEQIYKRELKKAKQQILAGQTLQKWGVIILVLLLTILAALQFFTIWEQRKVIADYQNRIEWLWMVNEDAIKAEAEKQQQRKK